MGLTEAQNTHNTLEQCINNIQEEFNESDDPWYSDGELDDEAAYDRKIAEIEYNRIRALNIDVGIKKGIDQVYNSSLQSGFDKGYEIGTKIGVRVGKIKGILSALSQVRKVLQLFGSQDGNCIFTEFAEGPISNGLLEYLEDVEGTFEKYKDILKHNNLFANNSEEPLDYNGLSDLTHILKPNLEELESAETYVTEFLYTKCRWPSIAGFDPVKANRNGSTPHLEEFI